MPDPQSGRGLWKTRRINVELGEERNNATNSVGTNRRAHRRICAQGSRLTSAVADAIEDGVGAAKRVVKQGGDAAEEFFDNTTKRLQRHPIETVITSLAEGMTVGIMIGWMIKRR